MSLILWANGATTTLAGAVSNVATSAAFAVGTGSKFPSPAAGQYYNLTFQDAATQTLTEICHVTAMSGDTATLVRAQEGTVAQNWNTGDFASNFVTAGTMQYLEQLGNALPTRNVTTNSAVNLDCAADVMLGVYLASPAPITINVAAANIGALSAGQRFFVADGNATLSVTNPATLVLPASHTFQNGQNSYSLATSGGRWKIEYMGLVSSVNRWTVGIG